ncbi:hypothetical protein [Flavitalea sp.]|nr:hypothetical protein [Flavitalea sp.]
MEFDELQKVWDSQNDKPLYAIDENALHNRIISKKNKGRHISNISEFLTILVNFATGAFILGINILKENPNISMYLLSAWMFSVAVYTLVSRSRRIKNDNLFDRSIRGDLFHAVSVANYQVKFSRLMRWNILPISLFMVLSVMESGKSIWLAVGTSVFLILANYAAGWEHNIYKTRKLELEILRDMLENDKQGELAAG